ncbi:MAG: hypothetical protein ACREDR_09505 [Blastocatellia bacterium]
MRIAWEARATPLVPAGAWALGAAAENLARRLLALDDQHFASLAGLARIEDRGLLIILGEEAFLPWVDGICYLGRDEQAPSLLLPTNFVPTAPLPLLERALLQRASASKGNPPLVVIPDPPSICWAGNARPFAREVLSARFLYSELPG